MIIQDYLFDGISFTTYKKDDNQKKPLLFFFHGFKSNRTKGIMGRGEVLANLGFYVVAIDAYLHGDRETYAFTQLTHQEQQREMFNIQIQTAKDAKHLYNKYFKDWKDINHDAVYSFGVSMGAGASFYLATIMDELKTMVTIVGSPSYYASYQEKASRFEFKDDLYYKQNLAFYKQMCPLLHYEKLKNKHIFMATGIHDTVVPMKFAHELSKTLKQSTIIFKSYDTAHLSTPEMLSDAYDYLSNHLQNN